MPELPMPPDWVRAALREGIAIPAHPLALTRERRLDERRQRALTRYYHAAGAGGIAAGVHTTQFAIREPEHGLLRPVLELAAATAAECDAASGDGPGGDGPGARRTVLVAGICGPTAPAIAEAKAARELGYHIGLLSLSALKDVPDGGLVAHCRAVAREIPLFGFYLQPAVGGRELSVNFWRRFAEIENAAAIKVAAFDRYRTLDVVRAVAEAGRAGDIALYTGNDDSIVIDLLAGYAVASPRGEARLGFAGGLLGHWACWTRAAVRLLEECKAARRERSIPAHLLAVAGQVTDMNAAIFDAANRFKGCIPGVSEALRLDGLLENTLCLDPRETLSPGQAEEIARVRRAYPHLQDGDFVRENLDRWLR